VGKESKPTFSIITPTYKRSELLRRNILSLQGQSFGDYEHIIVDDACDPDTSDLIRGINDPRIIYLSHPVRSGAAASYNTGIKNSKGNFILFLDDDDEYMPALLEKVHERFSSETNNLDFLWTGVSRIRDFGTKEIKLSDLKWPIKFANKEDALVAATSIGNGFGLCIRRKCVESVGLFDEGLKIGCDTDYLFRIAESHYFETIPEILVKIHQHDYSQLTDQNNNPERILAKETILLRYDYLLKKYPRLYFVHYYGLAATCYNADEKRKGEKAFISIIKLNPFRLLTYADFISYELVGKNFGNTAIGRKVKQVVKSN
jgi:glycosyltransferase involved in cell wall biosynthesis